MYSSFVLKDLHIHFGNKIFMGMRKLQRKQNTFLLQTLTTLMVLICTFDHIHMLPETIRIGMYMFLNNMYDNV